MHRWVEIVQHSRCEWRWRLMSHLNGELSVGRVWYHKVDCVNEALARWARRGLPIYIVEHEAPAPGSAA